MRSPTGGRPGRRPAISLIPGPSHGEWSGRNTIRSHILGFTPVEADTRYRPHPSDTDDDPDVLWKLVASNDLTLGIRTKRFTDSAAAHKDIRRIVDATPQLSSVIVGDARHRSWWILHRNEIVLVGARLWARSRYAEADREARQTLAALRTIQVSPEVAITVSPQMHAARPSSRPKRLDGSPQNPSVR